MPETARDAPDHLLILNAGSSGLKFAIFARTGGPGARLRGNIEVVGGRRPGLDQVKDRAAAFMGVAGGWAAIGHRIVHGGENLIEPRIVDAAVVAELKRICAFAPEHLPLEIALVEEVAARFPTVPQILCFDTAFHRELPRVAKLLPIPRRYAAAGVRRYGFHGLSYEFLRDELARLGDPAVSQGRVILAHLGNGASLAALMDGKCIDTSMGFTPAAGLVMGTRAGDLDPGLLAFLAQSEGMSADDLARMVNHESGLLGISGTSADMRTLLALAESDERAADAIEIFCRQAVKWIGGYAALLGGLDTLVFSGGIGENNAEVRARICARLGFIGIALDDARNAEHAAVVSAAASRVCVRVIATDEELVIARAARNLLDDDSHRPENKT